MATNKLLEKGGDIFLPPTSPAPAASPKKEAVTSRPKTAIGGLASFMVEESKTQAELDALRLQHAKFVGATPNRLLDPRSISASQWANRHEDSFKSAKFFELREEIRSAGGNVQPIKVRPIPKALTQAPSSVEYELAPGVEAAPIEYEIVFGHRRHRACLELGIPVLAMIEDTTDQRLFVDMDRENRQQARLSPWEQGTMYANALDKGLFPSNTQLAAAIGRDASDIGKALSVVRLPSAVIAAFESPIDIQFRWAKPLNEALLADPDVVIERAKNLAKNKKKRVTAKESFEILTGLLPFEDQDFETPATHKSPAAMQKIKVGKQGKTGAVLSVDGKGLAHIRFKVELADDRRQALANLIENFLAS